MAYDRGSRHGTELNGVRMIPNAPYMLETNDILKLARGTGVLHFSYSPGEQTLEFEPPDDLPYGQETEGEDVVIYWENGNASWAAQNFDVGTGVFAASIAP
ncbi:hypothetical protein HMSSN036_41760 [Paenibacillus macerans]|nr:hypothetical protein HMSSN036_41760 [Paenibacillus macerans]